MWAVDQGWAGLAPHGMDASVENDDWMHCSQPARGWAHGPAFQGTVTESVNLQNTDMGTVV